MTAPSCRVHGWAGCWQAAPVDPARLQSIGPADAPMLTPAMVPAWWCKLWAMRASGRRRASEADGCSKGLPAAWCACAQSIGPGVRAGARNCIGSSFEVVDLERGARGKRWCGDGPCWAIGGGCGVGRLRGQQAVASGDGGCTGWLRRAEQRCTSERQTRQCEWSVRAGGRCWPATAAASGMAAAAAAARATATCAVECGDNNGRGLAGAGRRRRRRLAAATRWRRRDGGDATAA